MNRFRVASVALVDFLFALANRGRPLVVAGICLYAPAALSEARATDVAPQTDAIEIYMDGAETTAPGSPPENAEPSGQPQQKARLFCVRTCDGFYFPLDLPVDASSPSDAASACHSACPSAEVLTYYQDGASDSIEQAKTLDENTYGASKNAFRYRSTLTAACACRRSTNLNDAILTDPTLRKGDIVVTSRGLVMFRGFESTNLLENNFSPVRSEPLPPQFEAEIRNIDRQYPDVSGQSPRVQIIRELDKSQDKTIRFVNGPAPPSERR